MPAKPCLRVVLGCAAYLTVSCAGASQEPTSSLTARTGTASQASPESRESRAAAAPVAIPDERITSAVLAALSSDEVVDTGGLRAGTTQGIVELEGTVPHLLAKERAGLLASSVKGVRSVSNRLRVTTTSVEDRLLQTRVQSALSIAPGVDARELSVVVEDGHVRLQGTVPSWARLSAAESVVKAVRGVREVTNEVAIVYRTQRLDDEIERDVESRLRWDALVDDATIDVRVAGGRVRLDGYVRSAAERMRAERLAWVSGVNAVNTRDVVVRWWAPDNGLRRVDEPSLPSADVERAIEDAIALDPRVQVVGVDVGVSGGIATLRGEVADLRARLAAESVARHTVGVRGVINQLTIRAASPASDEVIRGQVSHLLLLNPYTDLYEIEVDVASGVVTLSGTVETQFERAQAEDLAGVVRGVQRVDNDLAARRPGSRYVPSAELDPTEPLIAAENYLPATAVKADRQLQDAVRERLRWAWLVDAEQVDVSARGGTVTLSGTVDSYAERRAAVETAFEAGAMVVTNHLRVAGEAPDGK